MINSSLFYKLFIFYIILTKCKIKSHIIFNNLNCLQYGIHILNFSPTSAPHPSLLNGLIKVISPLISIEIYNVNDKNVYRIVDPEPMPKWNDIIYCPMELFGLYPHPFSNQKYLKCVDGRLYNKTCNAGYAFNYSSKLCEEDQRSLFKTLPRTQQLYVNESIIETRAIDNLTYLKCPKGLRGIFAHPFYCEKYIKCSPAGIKIEKCKEGEIFYFRQDKCATERYREILSHVDCMQNIKNVDPQESLSTTLGVFCDPKVSMNYPHPETMRKFVQCDNGKLEVKFCPRNMIFSLEDRICMSEEALLAKDNDYQDV